MPNVVLYFFRSAAIVLSSKASTIVTVWLPVAVVGRLYAVWYWAGP